MKLDLRLLGYLRPHLRLTLTAFLCMLLLNVTTVWYAALMGPALEFVFTGNIALLLRARSGELRDVWKWVPHEWLAFVDRLEPRQGLWLLPAAMIVIAVVKGLGQAGQFFLFGQISQRILRTLRQELFAALLCQPPAFYSQRTQGDLLSRLNNDTLLVEQAFFYGVGSVLRDSLAVLALLGYLFWSDPVLSLATFVVVPVAVVPLTRFSRWLKRVSKRGQVAQAEINAVTHESLGGVRVVQAFGNEARELRRLDKAAMQYYREMLVSYLIRAIRTPTMETLGAMVTAVLVAALGYHVQAGKADPAHYVSFLGAIFLMYDPLKKLGRVSDYLAAGSAGADRLFEIIDRQPEIRDAPDAVALPRFADRVSFARVSFSYGDEPVLREVELELKAGEMIALVGASGSGKTTLANLLPRFYDVTGGAIRIDGRDIRSVTLASLRAQIGVVSQDTFLFNASVSDNIAYGAAETTPEAIRRAAQAAYAEAFVQELPQGYATVIGERGVRLSGGQRQRLAIARALLRDAPLLILDEATSALDVESERFVQQALERLMEGRTSLVIAHRLTTVRRANVILVLKDGRICERGTHADLLARGGEYARLYELQFEDEVRADLRPS